MTDIFTQFPSLATNFMGQSYGVWLSFFVVVLTIMAFDLGFLSRSDKVISPKVSLFYSMFYIVLAIIFGTWLWGSLGNEHGMDYFTAYVIELSLSLDNLFVMSIILAYFNIPRKYQHKVLFWGIIGVLVMRGVMIGSGIAIVQSYEWVLYIFALFLIFTGVKMLVSTDKDDEEDNVKDSLLIRFFQKHLRCTKELDGHKFFVTLPSKTSSRMVWHATPLFMALLSIEFMDVVFALDSVPAVFAIIGLRSMYFAVVALLDRFKYMNFALSIVLIFIGGKVFYAHYIGEIHHFVSLGITVGILVIGILYSLYKTRHESLD